MNWNKTTYNKINHWFVNFIAENKAANLVYGSGFFLHSTNEKINNWLQNLIKENNLYQLFYKQEKIFSINGNSIMWAEKNPNFKTFQLRINNPIFPVYVKMDGEKVIEVLCVETRNRSASGAVAYELIKLTVNSIQYSNTIAQPQMLATTQSFNLSRYINTNNQMFIYSLNKPLYNPYFININFSNPDTGNLCQDDYDKLDSYYNMIERDQYVSQNRIIAKDKFKYDKDLPTNEEKYLKNSVILQDESVSLFGGLDLKNEFMRGGSQNKAWWENFSKQLNNMCEKCNYSYEMTEKNGATATENHYSKGNDVQTTAIKRKIRTENFYNLLDSMLIEDNLWNGVGLRPYVFKINDHFVLDKSKHLENTAKELALGKPLSRIVMEANDITKEQAYEQLKEAQEDIKRFPELFALSGEALQNGDPTNPSAKTGQKQTNREIIK